MNDPFKMTSAEKRSGMALSLIYFLRMMGLFMILPVMAIYAEGLSGSTPLLIGLAVGIYGLTQALFQIPFGMLSDRFGRKPVITVGLLIFAAGSLLAAMSTSIEGVIIGRTLQGAGAVASAIMALAADLTREEQRTKVMAMIGISIGLSFSIAFIVGPLLLGVVGGNGIFVISALCAVLAIGVLYMLLPTPVNSHYHRECQPAVAQLAGVLGNANLLRLDSGIFFLHVILTACFVVIPLQIRDGIGLDVSEHWKIYVPVFITSVVLMMPFLRMAESKGKTREIFIGAIVLLSFSLLGIYLTAHTVLIMSLLLVLFFTAFNLLEANLPSLI
jgi:MFS family permease